MIPSVIERIELAEPFLMSANIGNRWNDFAAKCGGSYFCAYGYVISNLPRRVRLFEVFSAGQKIGQCAIARGRFLDSLQLLPGYSHFWYPAMREILARIPPGEYEYGSIWNMEIPREPYLEMIPLVTRLTSQHHYVQAVDFAVQPDWETYERSLATNARRNAAKARKSDENLAVTYSRGLATLRDTSVITRLRHDTWTRKGLRYDAGQMAARYAMRCCLYRRYIWTGKIIHSSSPKVPQRIAAVVSGVEFGENVYYIDGASLPDNNGASWYLLIETMRRAFHKNPRGKFVMGVDRGLSGNNKPGWENLNRSRQQCRVSRFSSSVVKFQVRHGSGFDLP
jgi:hypothetical protein